MTKYCFEKFYGVKLWQEQRKENNTSVVNNENRKRGLVCRISYGEMAKVEAKGSSAGPRKFKQQNRT